MNSQIVEAAAGQMEKPLLSLRQSVVTQPLGNHPANPVTLTIHAPRESATNFRMKARQSAGLLIHAKNVNQESVTLLNHIPCRSSANSLMARIVSGKFKYWRRS